MFVGRWTVLHKGHEALINTKLSQGIPVLICIRDTERDEANPLRVEVIKKIIEKRYEDNDLVKVMIIPDIESINWGRGVGYEVNEHTLPEDIKRISGTELRKKIKEKDESWKELIDESIHRLIHQAYRRL